MFELIASNSTVFMNLPYEQCSSYELHMNNIHLNTRIEYQNKRLLKVDCLTALLLIIKTPIAVRNAGDLFWCCSGHLNGMH